MMKKETNVSDNLKSGYTNQYDGSMQDWRMLGAKYKADNIIKLAKGLGVKSVLEVGAGDGAILHYLSQHDFSDNLNAVEISSSGIEAIKARNLKGLKSVALFDGYKLPFEDNAFDLVICSHVLEHVEYERILLREIKRVSKYQIFEVPIDFSFYVDKKVEHFLSYGHINIYTPGLFRFLLLSEGFSVRKDILHLLNDKMLNTIYKGKKLAIFTHKVKNMILRLFPYLLGIKPSAYAVLTEKTDKEITIF